ncbi:hypothetical protein [Micromonospora sp. NPDC051141]|uniref:hypothetical protein n=1 Tax=Micromonospora sp. NPDC051141 TaxID=3364284 RepID=UPI003789DFD9
MPFGLGGSKYRTELQSQLDQLAITYTRQHPRNSADGRAELCAEIRQTAQEAIAAGQRRAVEKASGYQTIFRAAMESEIRNDYDLWVRRAFDGLV